MAPPTPSPGEHLTWIRLPGNTPTSTGLHTKIAATPAVGNVTLAAPMVAMANMMRAHVRQRSCSGRALAPKYALIRLLRSIAHPALGTSSLLHRHPPNGVIVGGSGPSPH